jgi:hypothetical protein
MIVQSSASGQSDDRKGLAGAIIVGTGGGWGIAEPGPTGLQITPPLTITPPLSFGTQGGTIAAPQGTTLWTFQPSDPAKGPWQAVVKDTLYGTTIDSIFSLGYNYVAANVNYGVVPTEPSWVMNFEEAYYVASTNTINVEWYVQYESPGAAIYVRPLGLTMNRATGASNQQYEIGTGDPNYGSFVITSNSVALLSVTATGVTPNIPLTPISSITQTVANAANNAPYTAYEQVIGTDPTNGATLFTMGVYPSLTAANKYAFLSCGDNNAWRPIYIGTQNKTAWSNVYTGPLTCQPPLGVGSNHISFGATAPTTGTWAVGDVCFSTAVTATTSPGWSCTTAGTPGTWTAWPVL